MAKLAVFNELKIHVFFLFVYFCIIVQVQNPGLIIEYDVIYKLIGFFCFGGGGLVFFLFVFHILLLSVHTYM